MKRTLTAVLFTAFITFVLTENFALTHLSVQQLGTESGYLVSMFGVETLVK